MHHGLKSLKEVENLVVDLDVWAMNLAHEIRESVCRRFEATLTTEKASRSNLAMAVQAGPHLVEEVGIGLLIHHLSDIQANDAARRLNVAVHAERAITNEARAVGKDKAEEKQRAKEKELERMRRALTANGMHRFVVYNLNEINLRDEYQTLLINASPESDITDITQPDGKALAAGM